MRDALIETWNGEGHSTENRCLVRDYADWMAAYQAAVELVRQSSDVYILIAAGPACTHLSYSIGDDDGSVQVFPLQPDTVGCVIYCNTNEARLVNAVEYDALLAEAKAQADPQEPLDAGNPFIAAFKGDYDYQFIQF